MSRSLADMLAPEGATALASIRAQSRTLTGAVRPIQAVVERALPDFDVLLDGGVSPKELRLLLAEIGVVARGGEPIAPGTLSSAICRARKHPRQSPAVDERWLPTAASNCARLRDAAVDCMRLPAAVSDCDRLLAAASTSSGLTEAAFSSIPSDRERIDATQVTALRAHDPAFDGKEGADPPAATREPPRTTALGRGVRLLAIKQDEAD